MQDGVSGLVSRRAILQGAILLVGGSALPGIALGAAPAAFFSAGERKALDALCDAMIPRTDTPGALDAGVPAFLDTLMGGWASAEHQAAMRAAVADLAQAAQRDAGKPLAALSAAERGAWLAGRDAVLIAARDPGYLLLKRLVMTGYYYSEPGATQELRYELVPGVWEPAVAITPDTRAWAA
jgi:gluconate 2-dehydrogenase gamma chain